jgi:hypothetical protein
MFGIEFGSTFRNPAQADGETSFVLGSARRQTQLYP